LAGDVSLLKQMANKGKTFKDFTNRLLVNNNNNNNIYRNNKIK